MIKYLRNNFAHFVGAESWIVIDNARNGQYKLKKMIVVSADLIY